MARARTDGLTPEERFEHYVERAAGCWLWRGPTNRGGYGLLNVGKGQDVLAHRWAAQQSGMDVTGRLVCHSCDTPACVRPDHLFVGSDADNHTDKARKLRAGKVLEPTQVQQIKATLAGAHPPLHVIAAEYGVSRRAIQRIKNGHYWRHA